MLVGDFRMNIWLREKRNPEILVSILISVIKKKKLVLISEGTHIKRKQISNPQLRTSLLAQWLRIRLPMQVTEVQALVRRDTTCRGAAKPLRHNYWACTLEPMSHNYWAHARQLLKPARLEPVFCSKRRHRNEKPLLTATRESPLAAMKTQCSQK